MWGRGHRRSPCSDSPRFAAELRAATFGAPGPCGVSLGGLGEGAAPAGLGDGALASSHVVLAVAIRRILSQPVNSYTSSRIRLPDETGRMCEDGNAVCRRAGLQMVRAILENGGPAGRPLFPKQPALSSLREHACERSSRFWLLFTPPANARPAGGDSRSERTKRARSRLLAGSGWEGVNSNRFCECVSPTEFLCLRMPCGLPYSIRCIPFAK